MSMNNSQELRSNVVLLNTTVNTMCNVNSIEEVNDAMLKAKDLLVEIYKLNAARVLNK